MAWVYAFRFLRVSLSLELSTHQDALSALSHLKSISSLAAEHGDKAILAIAKIIETMIHMQQSNSIEAFEQAQRSLAEARSCQLNPLVASLPQLSALMQLLDLCSTLQNFDPFQAITKVETLQSTLESISDSGAWNEDGSFAIPIHQVMNSSAKSTSGIVRDLSDTSLGLMFNWLPGDDVYLLGFLFSGITLTHKNTTNGQKAEKMLWEGLRTLDSKFSSDPGIPLPYLSTLPKEMPKTQARSLNQSNAQRPDKRGGSCSNIICSFNSFLSFAAGQHGPKPKSSSINSKKPQRRSPPHSSTSSLFRSPISKVSSIKATASWMSHFKFSNPPPLRSPKATTLDSPLSTSISALSPPSTPS